MARKGTDGNSIGRPLHLPEMPASKDEHLTHPKTRLNQQAFWWSQTPRFFRKWLFSKTRTPNGALVFAFLPLLRLAPRIGVYFFMPMLDLCRIFTVTTMSTAPSTREIQGLPVKPATI